MTIWLADAHAHVQRLVSVVKMATVPEEFTNKDQGSFMRVFFVGRRDSMQRIYINVFFFTVGSVCRVKRFATESRNSLNDVRKSQMI
jgi:hypothetical protein